MRKKQEFYFTNRTTRKANITEKSTCDCKCFFWWGKVDSDHRSQRQQIYSLPPLATREFPHIQLCNSLKCLIIIPHFCGVVKGFFEFFAKRKSFPRRLTDFPPAAGSIPPTASQMPCGSGHKSPSRVSRPGVCERGARGCSPPAPAPTPTPCCETPPAAPPR